jgi:VIT1/CCC1 family predicted Fe2+/Mn2+ transporter
MPCVSAATSWKPFFGLDRERFRERVTDVNDGIVSVAGVVEGLTTAGAAGTTVVVASIAALLAGAVAAGGTAYTEAADLRDTGRALVEEERRQLELSPEEELAELTAYYEGKGLSPELAREVAGELSAGDALAAHTEAEYGFSPDGLTSAPTSTAFLAGLAFAVGASVPLAVILIGPDSLRVAVTLLVVCLSLTVTSIVVARAGGTSVSRTVARTVVIGVVAMLLSLTVGLLLHDEVAEELGELSASAALLI